MHDKKKKNHTINRDKKIKRQPGENIYNSLHKHRTVFLSLKRAGTNQSKWSDRKWARI